jgi:hypothetical protein
MNTFKIGDRVRAVKKSKHFAPFEKGWEGVIEDITDKYPNFFVLFENDDDSWWLTEDEIELIEAEPKERLKIRNNGEWILPDGIEPIEPEQCASTLPGQTAKIHENALRMFARANAYAGDKPFPTFNEFINELVKADPRHKERFCYHYFAQFGKQPSQPNSKPFPTFEEFCEWYRTEQGNMQGVYHYFAQFGKQPSQPNSKPFPTFEEFDTWYCETEPVKNNGECKWTQQVYDYLVQFGVREVFPEVGKEYEFSEDGENWRKDRFESYESNNSIGFTHIRPIQPTRLEQLKAKHPNLTDTEQKELIDLLLTQTKQTQ